LNAEKSNFAISKIFGVPLTINSANYIYFLAYHELFSLRASTTDASGSSSTIASHEIDGYFVP
jgi:geranylgeranyl diphosphate synthase, type III